jgi:hypothetical protein
VYCILVIVFYLFTITTEHFCKGTLCWNITPKITLIVPFTRINCLF